MSADELEALLGKIGDEYRPLIETLAFTGLRISEALHLRWRDVDLESGVLTVSKSKTKAGEETPVKLLPRALRVLQAHRKAQAAAGIQLVRADAYVFASPATATVPHRRNVLRAVSTASRRRVDAARPAPLADRAGAAERRDVARGCRACAALERRR